MSDCELYKHDRPSYVTETHHVVPRSWFAWAKVPVDTPMMDLCPTCHSNVHYIIDRMVTGYWSEEILGVPPRQVHLARTAMELAAEKGLKPRRTL